MLAPLRLLGGGGHQALGKVAQVRPLRDVELECVRFGQQVLPELLRKLGELSIDLPQLLLGRVVEVGAGADELLVALVEEATLLGVELQRVRLVVDDLHACEQVSVERDVVAVGRQLRSDLARHLSSRIVRMCRVDREEDARHPIERLP